MLSSQPPFSNSLWFSTFGDESRCNTRLFGFPYGGAGAGAFRGLIAKLPDEWMFSAMVAPGRERRFREPGFASVHELVAALLPEIVPMLDRPFAFLGHSVGALVAFELCRSLRAAGLPLPDLLCVSARVAPQSPLKMGDFHTLSADDLVAAVIALHAGSFGPAPDPTFIRAVLPQLRADFAITDTYCHVGAPALTTPILAIGSASDPSVAPADLLAWREQTIGEFCTCILPDGGHFFLDRHASTIMHSIWSTWNNLGQR
jgi:medium-chain acyl-[acyl-carrier-protein] hydrolase